MSSLPKGSFGLAIDYPNGLWGKGGTYQKLYAAVQDLRNKGYNAHCYMGDSGAQETVNMARQFFPFDAALIDGDHTYEGVKADWENYGPMADIVAFHDIVGDGQFEKKRKIPVEVPKLWKELKGNKIEFIAHGSKMGIGVIT